MYTKNIRFGFATNSSSSHSIIMLRPGYVASDLWTDDNDCGLYEYGWELFRLADVDSKTAYIIAQFVSNIRRTDSGQKLGFIEVQKLVLDIFGVTLTEKDYGDPKWPSISVDHQSVLGIPSSNIEFWKAMAQYIKREDIIILGGNDNSERPDPSYIGAPHDTVDWFDQLSDSGSSKVLTRRDGDVWAIFNTENGTKVRIYLTTDAEKSYDKASAPELVDLKITQFCPYSCPFCHQGSTKNGQHAPKELIFKIIRQLKKLGVFEIAIGGGEPTMHPDFIEILEYAHKMGIVPNFTTNSVAWLKNEDTLEAVSRYVGGVGVSTHTSSDVVNKVKKIRDALASVSKQWRVRPKVMAQHVLGTLPIMNTIDLMKGAMASYIPLLLLGYKNVGFGQNVTPEDFTDFPTLLKLALSDNDSWCQISVDTAILNQFPDLLRVLDVSELLATSEEGKFSCYIDAVTGEMGPSSYAPGQMEKLPTTYRGVKNLFARY